MMLTQLPKNVFKISSCHDVDSTLKKRIFEDVIMISKKFLKKIQSSLNMFSRLLEKISSYD